MSTNVPLVANIPASGKSAWASYITADEMLFSIALGGFEDVPDESNFKANIYQFAPSAFDPGGEIGKNAQPILNSAISVKPLQRQYRGKTQEFLGIRRD